VSAVRWGMPAPSHWLRTRVKYVCRFAGGGTPDKGNIEYWNGEIPWVSPKDMKSSEIIDTEDHITKAGLDSSPTKLLEAGAVLIVMRSGISRHSIPVAINRVPVTLNHDMRALIPTSTLEPRYLARLIEGHQRQFLNVWSKEGTTVESLESDLVADTEIAVPPLLQQRAIADYLDHETARLDGLVAAKERVLGLVEEKRRALITRVVTRGLDPYAPLYDSVIPWLGEIPAHWKLARLKHFAAIYYGLSQPPDYVPSGVPFLRATNVKRGELTKDGLVFVDEEVLPDSRVVRLCAGDIIIVRSGAYTGDSAIVTEEWVGAVAGYDMVARVVRRAIPEFVSRALLCQYVLEAQIDPLRLRAAQPHLNAEELGDISFALPPIDEQRAIVAHIAAETAKLDALRSATERTIALLRERRTALIAAAVSGKLDVQGAGRHIAVVAD
jgi:type I restriction enzyme S subunit